MLPQVTFASIYCGVGDVYSSEQKQYQETLFGAIVENHHVDTVSEDELPTPKTKKVRTDRVQRSLGEPQGSRFTSQTPQ